MTIGSIALLQYFINLYHCSPIYGQIELCRSSAAKTCIVEFKGICFYTFNYGICWKLAINVPSFGQSVHWLQSLGVYGLWFITKEGEGWCGKYPDFREREGKVVKRKEKREGERNGRKDYEGKRYQVWKFFNPISWRPTCLISMAYLPKPYL